MSLRNVISKRLLRAHSNIIGPHFATRILFLAQFRKNVVSYQIVVISFLMCISVFTDEPKTIVLNCKMQFNCTCVGTKHFSEISFKPLSIYCGIYGGWSILIWLRDVGMAKNKTNHHHLWRCRLSVILYFFFGHWSAYSRGNSPDLSSSFSRVVCTNFQLWKWLMPRRKLK